MEKKELKCPSSHYLQTKAPSAAFAYLSMNVCMYACMFVRVRRMSSISVSSGKRLRTIIRMPGRGGLLHFRSVVTLTDGER